MRVLFFLWVASLGVAPLAAGAEGKKGFETVNLTWYRPDEVLLFPAYIKRLEAICERFFRDSRTPEVLDIVVAIKPGKRA